MKNKPKISIVLLTYNRPHYLKYAIEAILNLTYRDFELIILDNVSNIETRELVSSYIDEKIEYFRCDVNSRDFMNSSFNFTDNDYLLITHDDDIMKYHYLETMLKEIEKGDYDLLGCAIEEIDTGNKRLGRIRGNTYEGIYKLKNEAPLREYFDQKFLACPTIIFKSSFVRDNNIKWDWSAGLAMDANLLVTCLSLGAKVANLGEPLYLYRIHDNQDSMMNNVPMHLDLFSHWMRRRDIRFSNDEISFLHKLALKYIEKELRRSKAKYSNIKKSFNYLKASIWRVFNLESIKYFYKTGVWLVKYNMRQKLNLSI